MFKIKPATPRPEFEPLVYPHEDATSEEFDAYYDERERRYKILDQWEEENKWYIRFGMALAFLLIPVGAIFWGIGNVKERFTRGR